MIDVSKRPLKNIDLIISGFCEIADGLVIRSAVKPRRSRRGHEAP